MGEGPVGYLTHAVQNAYEPLRLDHWDGATKEVAVVALGEPEKDGREVSSRIAVLVQNTFVL